jgi:parallel beta-helix repeat protein
MKKKLTIVPILILLVGFLALEGRERALADMTGAVIANPAHLQDVSFQPQSQRAAVSQIKSTTNYVEVDDDGVECSTVFTTIQEAVNSGAGEIRVCAGTYPENVTIGPNANLKLKGDGIGQTVVTGNIVADAGPIIYVQAGSKVDINDLTVDGGSAMTGSVVHGIRYDDANGKIENVEVLNIRDASGSSQGVGIRVQSSGPEVEVTVENSYVENYTRVGTYGNGPGVMLKVEKNTIIGPVDPRVWAPNGIQISRGAKGWVKDNLVDNNPSPNPSAGGGSGIILFCAGPTTVEKNTVTNADFGISLADQADADVHDNEILNSGFDGISLQFLGLYFSDIGCSAVNAPLPVKENDVQENYIVDSGDTGISLANFNLDTESTNPNDNRIEENNIAGSVVDGIHVFDGTDNRFEENEITSSGQTDAVDATSGGGTAGTANTWEENECSTSSPSGLCGDDDDEDDDD